MEDQKADRDDRRDRDGKAGIDQRDRRNDDCRPGERGFPFFCDRDFFDFDDDVFDHEIDQRARSGDIDQEVDISLSGDNSNQCVAVVQFGNTGNNQNARRFDSPFFDDFDRHRFRDDFDRRRFRGFFDFHRFRDFEDFEAEGGFIEFAPEFENECEQSVQQVAVARRPAAAITRAPGIRAAVAGVAPRPGVAARPAVAGARGATISPSRAAPAGLGKAAPTGMLPRTGGIGTASLLTLGTGALLIGGGLLARRLAR